MWWLEGASHDIYELVTRHVTPTIERLYRFNFGSGTRQQLGFRAESFSYSGSHSDATTGYLTKSGVIPEPL
jgi:hypothetical protein